RSLPPGDSLISNSTEFPCYSFSSASYNKPAHHQHSTAAHNDEVPSPEARPAAALLVLAVALWSPAEGRSASGAAVEAAEAEGAARLSDQQWADDEEALLLSLLRQRAAAQAEKEALETA
uniref:Secreted protein n=1 Tax=Macrostomum lignano TaxID=282301 RepID=A0A1I8FL31_9PLAT